MDGLEATRRIRSTPNLATVPIIAISASATAEDQRGSMVAGASAFMTKPIDQEDLLAQIGNFLGLVWDTELPPKEDVASPDREPALPIMPPEAEMEVLYVLAQAGNMGDIRRRADISPRSANSIGRLPINDRLAKAYRSKAILELVEAHMRESLRPEDISRNRLYGPHGLAMFTVPSYRSPSRGDYIADRTFLTALTRTCLPQPVGLSMMYLIAHAWYILRAREILPAKIYRESVMLASNVKTVRNDVRTLLRDAQDLFREATSATGERPTNCARRHRPARNGTVKAQELQAAAVETGKEQPKRRTIRQGKSVEIGRDRRRCRRAGRRPYRA